MLLINSSGSIALLLSFIFFLFIFFFLFASFLQCNLITSHVRCTPRTYHNCSPLWNKKYLFRFGPVIYEHRFGTITEFNIKNIYKDEHFCWDDFSFFSFANAIFPSLWIFTDFSYFARFALLCCQRRHFRSFASNKMMYPEATCLDISIFFRVWNDMWAVALPLQYKPKLIICPSNQSLPLSNIHQIFCFPSHLFQIKKILRNNKKYKQICIYFCVKIILNEILNYFEWIHFKLMNFKYVRKILKQKRS